MLANPENDYLYNPALKERARELRRSMTKAEACLWKYVLRAGGMSAYGFHRQRPVLQYIADFFCSELMLIIEVDGPSHDDADQQVYDAKRTAALEAAGFKVLRYTNEDVLQHIAAVRTELEAWVQQVEQVRGIRSRELWREQLSTFGRSDVSHRQQ